jgi:hypothetical protein
LLDIERIDKFRDSTKLWIDLINDIGNLIEELMSLRLLINLINEINDLIEEILKFRTDLG